MHMLLMRFVILFGCVPRYCRFTHVRVPHDHMFNKYANVSLAGVYTAAPEKLSKFKYISMMVARVAIVAIANNMLSQAVTIAVRFSAVRRQGFKDTTANTGSTQTWLQPEHVVLDYQMQQYRIFKALSLSYCKVLLHAHTTPNPNPSHAASIQPYTPCRIHTLLHGPVAYTCSTPHAPPQVLGPNKTRSLTRFALKTLAVPPKQASSGTSATSSTSSAASAWPSRVGTSRPRTASPNCTRP